MLAFLFFALISVFIIFVVLQTIEQAVFRRKYEEKNPAERDKSKIIEEKVANEGMVVLDAVKEWWAKNKPKFLGKKY